MMHEVLADDMVAGAWKSTVNTIILSNISKSPLAFWHLKTFGNLGGEDPVMKVHKVDVVTYFTNIPYGLMKGSIYVL